MTAIAYGLFRIKGKKLFPLFVESNVEVPVKVWLKANEGKFVVKDNGRKYIKSRLGLLAYRPGKHLATIPLFNHIGKRSKNGMLQRSDTVICEVEYVNDVDWTQEAKRKGAKHYDQCLDHIPYGGFYYFKTNPKSKADWLIVEQYRINRILDDNEVNAICKQSGFKAQEREN